MPRRWTEGHAKTVMSQQPIAELDTHGLLEITQRIKERDTMDVALRVQNYLSTIMRSLSRFQSWCYRATTSTGSPCPRTR